MRGKRSFDEAGGRRTGRSEFAECFLGHHGGSAPLEAASANIGAKIVYLMGGFGRTVSPDSITYV